MQTEIAERVLGHAQDELIEIYDQYDYQSEMADALERLAGLIEQIVDPRRMSWRWCGKDLNKWQTKSMTHLVKILLLNP